MNALVPTGEEGRDKLRKATGIGTHDLIRRYLNGATRHVEDMSLR